MSQYDLQSRLNELQDSIKQTAQLIMKLSNAQPNEDSSVDEAADLAADIRESLEQEEIELELIKQDVEDAVGSRPHETNAQVSKLTRHESERDRDNTRTFALCQRLSEDLHTLRARFRKARLQSKKNADLAVQMEQEAYLADLRVAADALQQAGETEPSDKGMSYGELRTSLFTGRRGPARANDNQTKDDMLLTASTDLTSSLRRTHELIKDQLSQSRFAHETLEESNAALNELSTRYGALDDLLSKSRGLLGSLLRSQKSDTWYLETTRWMLAAVIAWLLFRRLLYGPLWWFAYLPLKFAWSIIAAIVRSGTGKNTSIPKSAFQHSRPPLIVQPSASGRLPKIFYPGVRPSVQVGAGGNGAKQMPGAESNEYSPSEDVSRIIDATQSFTDTAGLPVATVPASGQDTTSKGTRDQGSSPPQEIEQHLKQGSSHEETVRGDGTVLRERNEANEPKNPKKRMMEDPPRREQRKDEL